MSPRRPHPLASVALGVALVGCAFAGCRGNDCETLTDTIVAAYYQSGTGPWQQLPAIPQSFSPPDPIYALAVVCSYHQWRAFNGTYCRGSTLDGYVVVVHATAVEVPQLEMGCDFVPSSPPGSYALVPRPPSNARGHHLKTYENRGFIYDADDASGDYYWTPGWVQATATSAYTPSVAEVGVASPLRCRDWTVSLGASSCEVRHDPSCAVYSAMCDYTP